jgi:hypothetical protein
LDAEDRMKSVEKMLDIAQCIDHEKVHFVAHQLFGTATDWWETYRDTHTNVEAITWNESRLPSGHITCPAALSNRRRNSQNWIRGI